MEKRIVGWLLLVIFSLGADFEDGEYTQIECEIKLRVMPFEQEDRQTRSAELVEYSHPYIPQRKGTSSNWCGYIAATNFNRPQLNSVSAVYGSWIVPKVIPSVSAKTYCSLWVGIDGYGSNSVEQIGTAHEWRNGNQVHYAWFEMYPLASCEIVGFPVTPGDKITASVVYKGNGIFSMTLSNSTKKVTTAVPTFYTTSSTAQRISAEWIVEAPYLDGTLPLANFKNILFSGCTATINGIHGPINYRGWSHDILNMQNALMMYKATASPLLPGGESFSGTWYHE